MDRLISTIRLTKIRSYNVVAYLNMSFLFFPTGII